ncbi:AraC family transcriptional regulator [Butyricicoccus sp.]|uniref:AraC family transcriptional regulator n=1 Tax=Butyricicoccus sp. TaxID=2049021 RepID=UPI003F155FAB
MEDSYVLTVEEKERPSFHELTLCFCGHSVCHSGHSFGPAVRPNYILHYVLTGKGQFHIGNRTYSMQKEEGFLIEPNIMTTYRADDADPWEYLWIGFAGADAKKLLEQIGLSQHTPTFSASCGTQLLEIVNHMLESEASGIEQELYLQAQLYQFFALLSHDLSTRQRGFQQEQRNYYVRAAVEFIQSHYADNIKVTDIAAYVGISRSYLATLFQTIIGMSPNEYLTNFRLTRGMEQLTITNLPVSTIASRCGYRDPLVFSKAFKQMVGLTPTQYRKEDREKQHLSIQEVRKKRGL